MSDHPISLFDSRSRSKRPFVPLDAPSVRLYWCGPTVYDHLHIGHARAFVVPDVLRRYLEHRGYQVRFVSNFTDVDDKIIVRSIQERRSWRELVGEHIERYHEVMSGLLNNRPADAHPRATDHIPEMIAFIATLIDKGKAYVSGNGDVLFDVPAFPAYGALSGRDVADQRADADNRLSEEQRAAKRHHADFVLWKLHANDQAEWREAPREQVPGWDSPWGYGRPGWHIECSALSERYLGLPFDIHGGGIDLQFPHHENELAQNDAAHAELGCSSVATWLHNSHVKLPVAEDAPEGSDKMSKSLGNVIWIHELVAPHGPYDPMALRLALLSSHYRSPIDWEPVLLDQAAERHERWVAALERLDADAAGAEPVEVAPATDALAAFEAGMDDDLNTPQAIAAIECLAKASLKAAGGEAAGYARMLRKLLRLLGVRDRRAGASGAETQPLLELIIDLRAKAREAKDYGTSDQIRDAVTAAGFALEDSPEGTIATRLARKAD